MKYQKRPTFVKKIEKAFRTHPIVAVLGPRQCGKTTLADLYKKEIEPNTSVHRFDCEDPADFTALENPKTLFQSLTGLIVIDEIQRVAELFPVLRVLVDQDRKKRRFLILGSASRDLLKQSSETLAGRIAYIELTPFTHGEVPDREKLWLRGGFPHSYLAKTTQDSVFWRKQYISTFLERDIPNLGLHIPPMTLRRFWMMLTHYHRQTFHASQIAKSLGVSDTTAREYLDLLTATFMIRQLLPWFENTKKRQIKTPKIYFRDSGIYHTLSDIPDKEALIHHPRLGASWEGFALEAITQTYQVPMEECFFWGVHEQAEIDLFFMKGGKRLGFECKYSDAPKLTKSMEIAVNELHLDLLQVIYPGEKEYFLAPKILVRGLTARTIPFL